MKRPMANEAVPGDVHTQGAAAGQRAVPAFWPLPFATHAALTHLPLRDGAPLRRAAAA